MSEYTYLTVEHVWEKPEKQTRNKEAAGIMIRSARLKRGWSQRGLCEGICAVSYLSKIEQGKADAGDDVLRMLFERLGLSWHAEEEKQAGRLAEELYEAVFSMNEQRMKTLFLELEEKRSICMDGPYRLDFLLLEDCRSGAESEPVEEFESVMNTRQRVLWLLHQKRCEEALLLWPLPFVRAWAGYYDYRSGRYARAQERLQQAFDAASQECMIYVMLFCKLLMGNCYSDLNQYEQMLYHYRGAMRLASALGDKASLADIYYNIASTQMQFRHYWEAYEYFSRIEEPTVMDLHKLAICCEGLGKKEEAMKALKRADTAVFRQPWKELAVEMCRIVQYRLEHSDYLEREDYGMLLLDCFEKMKRNLPRGYAAFHLPWMEEWYTARRQYKQVCELLRDFPDYSVLNGVEREKTD